MERLVQEGMLSKAIEDSYRGAGEASLEKSTRGGAASAFNSWLRYCKMVGIDHTCGNLDGNLFNWNKMTMLIIGYISFEVGVRGLSPRSIVVFAIKIMPEGGSMTAVAQRRGS